MQRCQSGFVCSQRPRATCTEIDALAQAGQVLVNRRVGHVQAGADQLAALFHRVGHRCGWLCTGQEQQAAIGLGGQLILQQGFDPGLGAGVARQRKADQFGVVFPVLINALQPHGAALAFFAVSVVQRVAAVQLQNTFNVGEHLITWRFMPRCPEQNTCAFLPGFSRVRHQWGVV